MVKQVYEVSKEELREILSDVVANTLSATSQKAIDDKKPLDIEEASAFVGLAKQTIYKGTSEGTFPHHKQGGKLFFFREELVAWIKGQSKSAKVHLR